MESWYLPPRRLLQTILSSGPQSGATQYKVARSSVATFTEDCVIALTSQPFWIDLEEPPPGGVLFYLTRAWQPHVGSWGADSSGVERTGVCAP